MATMRALVYTDVDTVEFMDRPKPTVTAPTDAVVKMLHTTICGTDLHILKGDVPSIKTGRILGHEGVGVIESLGTAVDGLKTGDKVLISAITACGVCKFCRRGMSSHCVTGGWVLGNQIDGTQAEYARIPHATSSLYKLPESVDPRQAVMLSDALPTGLECGVLNGKVQPGNKVAIVGAGPVGIGVLLTASLYSPSLIVMIDLDDARLEVAKKLGAHYGVNPKAPDAMSKLKELTNGEGFDSVMEVVGVPATFEMCQELVAPGGTIANVGVHGKKVDLHLEKLWDRNISITTRLLDAVTIPMLLKLNESGTLNASSLVTHTFSFHDAVKAYGTFHAASHHQALKVVIDI
ncbi:hypothetical protein DTO164E3_776 [Paecilomyces variotii]|nr:hypothetical protein DTO164E3_776 [Paecilomyces variotii]KAJ9406329.1 hypothetical protein DTO045G8_5965 [Paecilomyces variotii]